jgi:hypothetical protein
MPKTAITLLIFLFYYLPALSVWETARNNWATVHYHPPEASNVQAVFRTLDSAYPFITANLGLEFKGKLDIYIASRPAEFGELTDWKLPLWAQGVAFPAENRIVLKSPRFSGSQVDLGRAAIHEFVHLLLEAEVGSVPRWLNEGLAVLLSGEMYFDDRPLSRASFSGKFLPLQQIESVMDFESDRAQLAYQQSLSATRYLVAQFGWNTVKKLLDNLNRGLPYDKSFLNATGIWPDEFENEWLKTTGSSLKLSVLKDWDFYFGVIFVPLLLLGGIMMFFRHRKIKKRWQEEEQEFFDFDN